MSHSRALAFAAALLFAAPASALTQKADYRFAGSLSSSVAGAPDLTFLIPEGESAAQPDNVPVYSGDGMSWVADRGLQMSTAGLVDQSVFSVVVRFKLASNACFVRILGFREVANDNDTGLYSCSGRLYAYNYIQAADPSLTNDTFAEVAFTRAADGTVNAYTNGALQLTTSDTVPEYNLLDNVLRLFRDNSGEESAGTISRLRVYDGSLTAAQVASVFAGNDVGLPAPPQQQPEQPSQPAQPSQPSQPSPAAQTPPAAPNPAGTLQAKGRTVTAACAALAPCTLTATLTAGKVTLGTLKAKLAAGQAKGYSVALSRAGKRKLRRAGKLKATLTAALAQAGGTTVTATRKVKLKAR